MANLSKDSMYPVWFPASFPASLDEAVTEEDRKLVKAIEEIERDEELGDD